MNFVTSELELDTKKGISVLYFYAPWLLLHKKMMEAFSKTEPHYKDIKFYAIDVSSFEHLCIRFNIESVPKILIMEDEGKIIKVLTGLILEGDLRSSLNDIYTAYTDKKLERK